MDEGRRADEGEVPGNAGAPKAQRFTVVAGRYELRREIGSGGMGVVWEAWDTQLRRFVALKGIRFSGSATSRAMARARREAQAIAHIQHQNVVSVHDVIETGSEVWIVMELHKAPSLADLLQEDQLSVPRAARLALQVLEGLGAVHQAGVLHRDIKPHNLLVLSQDRVLLVDFGIATFEGAEMVTLPEDIPPGTPKYLAPELLYGVSGHPMAATRQSDLWSLGVTLFEMVEGRTPFDGDTPWGVYTAVHRDPVPPMLYAGPLAEIITGLLSKDPGERPTAEKVEETLRRIVDSSPRGRTAAGAVEASGGGSRPEPRDPRLDQRLESSSPEEPGPDEKPKPAEQGAGQNADASGASRAEGAPVADGPKGAEEPKAAKKPKKSKPKDPGKREGEDRTGKAAKTGRPDGGKSGKPKKAGRPEEPGEPERSGRRGWWVAVAAAICLVLLAGGGYLVWDRQDDGQKSDGGPSADAKPEEDTGPKVEDASLERLEQARNNEKPWVIGLKDGQPGLSDLKDGKWSGVEYEYAKDIARSLGIPDDNVNFVAVGTEERANRLDNGFIQMMIGSYGISEERQRGTEEDPPVLFAGPYYRTQQKIMLERFSTKGDANAARIRGQREIVQSVNDLPSDTRICVVRKSSGHNFLRSNDKFKQVKTRSDYNYCIKGLHKQYDAVFTDEAVLKGFLKGREKEYMIARGGFSEKNEEYGIGLKAGSVRLCQEVLDAVRKKPASGYPGYRDLEPEGQKGWSFEVSPGSCAP
ncbi:protein kinase [Streptomyces sp. NPDC005438]|uniref:serine/threonine-protein kinase n=1 Tax=Streptomyces sp. NPDC005438 TaxID=3156880 RepID=UPI0033B548C6